MSVHYLLILESISIPNWCTSAGIPDIRRMTCCGRQRKPWDNAAEEEEEFIMELSNAARS